MATPNIRTVSKLILGCMTADNDYVKLSSTFAIVTVKSCKLSRPRALIYRLLKRHGVEALGQCILKLY